MKFLKGFVRTSKLDVVIGSLEDSKAPGITVASERGVDCRVRLNGADWAAVHGAFEDLSRSVVRYRGLVPGGGAGAERHSPSLHRRPERRKEVDDEA